LNIACYFLNKKAAEQSAAFLFYACQWLIAAGLAVSVLLFSLFSAGSAVPDGGC
jgi:hypothetical protein